ncbi:MAG: roadblock/LC7 domain-containing protein [Pedosphaera sp.]|nr:roadblock/LC7 domain-containing protein [Pedosphaera sp.]
MATLPQLIEEDTQALDKILREFLKRSDATAALILDKGGFLIAHHGDTSQFDVTTISALASGAYLANQTIANLVQETNFDSVYQQGENSSMFVTNVDENCLLLVIFPAQIGVGIVKFCAGVARERIAGQMLTAEARDPDGGFDLSELNIADTSSLFKRKE